MTIAEASALASAVYAVLVFATYFYLLHKAPDCRGRILRCISGKELAAVILIILAQTAIIALIAFIASLF